MTHTRVNIRSVCNTKAVRHEKRNGRDVIVVPSATLPDNVVMNGRMYPADEIAATFKGLERTPAPLGHPKVNGKYVSARDPEGINVGWIGAWNENVRQENGRVLLDKVIDVEIANRSESGKALLSTIEKGDPIHTSTGLFCKDEAAPAGAAYKVIARNMVWDHDAILLNEEGAATPDQGVGMFVNSSGEQEEIEVVNSSYDDAERDLDWAVESLARALDKRQRAPVLEQMKSAILSIFGLAGAGTLNTKEDDMAVSEEQFNELSAKVNAITDALKPEAFATAISNAVQAAVKPLTDAQDKMLANQKAKDDAEHAGLVAKVVKANLMTEEVAKELTLKALKGLAPMTEPGTAAAIAAGFKGNISKDEFEGYDLNANMEDK